MNKNIQHALVMSAPGLILMLGIGIIALDVILEYENYHNANPVVLYEYYACDGGVCKNTEHQRFPDLAECETVRAALLRDGPRATYRCEQ